jgi:hypothetical protein
MSTRVRIELTADYVVTGGAAGPDEPHRGAGDLGRRGGGRSRGSFSYRIPNAYILIFFLLVAAAALTWIVPPGQFARAAGPGGRTVVVPGSFTWIGPGDPLPDGNTVRPEPQGVWRVLRAPLEGFVAADIIVFILVIGGAFKVLDATGAVRAGIARGRRAAGRPRGPDHPGGHDHLLPWRRDDRDERGDDPLRDDVRPAGRGARVRQHHGRRDGVRRRRRRFLPPRS